ncbi:hypothetical protein EOL94_02270 [bacterium]|nr:hypothetical protein [bacterium]
MKLNNIKVIKKLNKNWKNKSLQKEKEKRYQLVLTEKKLTNIDKKRNIILKRRINTEFKDNIE